MGNGVLGWGGGGVRGGGKAARGGGKAKGGERRWQLMSSSAAVAS